MMCSKTIKVDKHTVALEGLMPSATVDIVSISWALVVAECLSFHRAANVLGIHQSSVSRRVRALEDALGVSLFERNHAGVRVTSAGTHFFNEARDALARIDGAAQAAASAGRGITGRVAIGISSSMGAGFLREVIHTYRERHPNVALSVSEGASSTQLAMVGKRRLDVAFVSGGTTIRHYEAAPLWSERIFIVLPEAHALCEKSEISWEVLGGEQLLLCKGDAFDDELNSFLAKIGGRRSVQMFDVHRDTLMHLVALRFGLGLTGEASTATRFPAVVFRPMAGDPATIRYSAVWSTANDNPAFRRFLSLARALAKRRTAMK
jgi:DNA-binding transcriptional LysR family regulator